MADLDCTLAPLPGSSYDNKLSYCFRIENTGDDPVDLVEIRPLSSAKMAVSEPAAPSRTSRKRTLDAAFRQLSDMATLQLVATSAEFRADLARSIAEVLGAAIRSTTSPLGLARLLYLVVRGRFVRWAQEAFSRADAHVVQIDQIETARDLLELFPAGSDRRTLYATRVERLERLLASGSVPRAVHTIEPGGDYETRFDVQFERRWLNVSPYTFAVEALYEEAAPRDPAAADTEPRSLRASETAFISPSPVLLTLTAVVSALVGVAIQAALEQPRDTDWAAVQLHVVSGYGFAALLLAGVVFNIYDHLDLGRTVTMPASWRSALLVGTLCGLFAVQILGSIGVLIGAAPSPVREDLHEGLSEEVAPVEPAEADAARLPADAIAPLPVDPDSLP